MERRISQQRFSEFVPGKVIASLLHIWSAFLEGGHGSETFMILPGGERKGDLAFTLMEHFEREYRCLYPAYPPVSTMEELIEGLAALLDYLEIEKVSLLAASFGGDVGQCFVRKYPARVRKLILLNTGIPDEALGRATKRGRPLMAWLPLGLVHWLVRKLLSKALAVRSGEQLFYQALLSELVDGLSRADLLSSFDDTIDYRLNYHFAPADLENWPGKVLIMQSDDDPATRPEMRQALRALYPQAQIHTLYQAGHTPFLSQPDAFYPVVEAFLRQP